MLHNHKHLNRVHKKSDKKPKHFIVMASSVIYPLTTIPQIIEIFTEKSAVNVSLATYVFYLLFTFIFLSYGISEKLKPIIVLQCLWLVVYSPVIVGLILYG